MELMTVAWSTSASSTSAFSPFGLSPGDIISSDLIHSSLLLLCSWNRIFAGCARFGRVTGLLSRLFCLARVLFCCPSSLVCFFYVLIVSQT